MSGCLVSQYIPNNCPMIEKLDWMSAKQNIGVIALVGAAGETLVGDVEDIWTIGDVFEAGPTELDREVQADPQKDAVRKLLITKLGLIKETDRDSYSMKRIDLAGSLLLELYRELWSIFQRNVSLKIDNNYKFHFKDFGNDIKNIINQENSKKVFN